MDLLTVSQLNGAQRSYACQCQLNCLGAFSVDEEIGWGVTLLVLVMHIFVKVVLVDQRYQWPLLNTLVIFVIIGSCNGLAPIWCQAITWTNADLLSIVPPGLQWNFNKIIMINILENAFQNVVCKIAAILSMPQCVNSVVCRQRWQQQYRTGREIVLFWVQFYWDLFLKTVSHITVKIHEHHDVSDQWQLDCLFNGLFRLTSKKTSELLLALCEGNPPMRSGFLWQTTNNLEIVPCHHAIR